MKMTIRAIFIGALFYCILLFCLLCNSYAQDSTNNIINCIDCGKVLQKCFYGDNPDCTVKGHWFCRKCVGGSDGRFALTHSTPCWEISIPYINEEEGIYITIETDTSGDVLIDHGGYLVPTFNNWPPGPRVPIEVINSEPTIDECLTNTPERDFNTGEIIKVTNHKAYFTHYCHICKGPCKLPPGITRHQVAICDSEVTVTHNARLFYSSDSTPLPRNFKSGKVGFGTDPPLVFTCPKCEVLKAELKTTQQWSLVWKILAFVAVIGILIFRKGKQ